MFSANLCNISAISWLEQILFLTHSRPLEIKHYSLIWQTSLFASICFASSPLGAGEDSQEANATSCSACLQVADLKSLR